jgi:hypothetical protein
MHVVVDLSSFFKRYNKVYSSFPSFGRNVIGNCMHMKNVNLILFYTNCPYVIFIGSL